MQKSKEIMKYIIYYKHNFTSGLRYCVVATYQWGVKHQFLELTFKSRQWSTTQRVQFHLSCSLAPSLTCPAAWELE